MDSTPDVCGQRTGSGSCHSISVAELAPSSDRELAVRAKDLISSGALSSCCFEVLFTLNDQTRGG